MTKKIIIIFLFSFYLLFLKARVCYSQTLNFDQLASSTSFVNSYELFYPTVAGILPTDKKYILKLIRDQLSLIVARNISDKVKIYVNLSDKRLLEAEQMMGIDKYDFAEKSLNQSQGFLLEAINLASRAKTEEEVISVSTMILDDASKHEKILPYLARNKEGSVYKQIEQNYLQAVAVRNSANGLIFRYLHQQL